MSDGPRESPELDGAGAAIRVVIADDDPLARRVVRDVLQRDGIVVVAEASTGREAVELTAYYKPDAVLMDVVMPDGDGIEATRRIMSEQPQTVVVMLTSADGEEIGLMGLRAGACGYLSKDLDLEAIPRALKGTLAGEAAISRQLTRSLIDRFRRQREDSSGMRPVKSVLTGREWEVLDLLMDGATTDGIAEDLVLSTETVRSHIKSILRKLEVNSRTEAVAKAKQMREEQLGAAPDGASA